MGLQDWWNKLRGKKPAEAPPPAESTVPSQRPLTEEEQEQRDRDDSPDEDP